MSDEPSLRSFVLETLADLGAVVSDGEPLVWVQAPESVRHTLEVPANFALTFEPDRSGEFEAELVAPGSYFLEKLLSVAVRRGRWELSRFEAASEDWVSIALAESGLGPADGVLCHVRGLDEEIVLLLSFRVTLVSDEKRETFHIIAVSPKDGSAWPVDPSRAESGLIPSPSAGLRPDLETAYRLATETLRERTREEVGRFRARCLGLLEEEVRRIFGYFDRTIEEIREADPQGSQDLVRGVMAERDRRLTEALERFDPKANASLCSVRAILVPAARIRLEFRDGTAADPTLDAWSRRIRGFVCGVCGRTDGPWRPSTEGGLRCTTCAATRVASARPRGRPRSDTPRRGTRAGEASARSPRGSKARSRVASSRHRGP